MKIAKFIIRADEFWENHPDLCNAIFGCVMGIAILVAMAYVLATGE